MQNLHNYPMKIFSAGCLLLLFCQHTYAADVLSAEFTDKLATVNVELCFDGAAPDRLYRNPQAGNWSDGIYHQNTHLRTPGYDGHIQLPHLPANACIRWQSNISLALAENNRRLISQIDEDLIMNADLWFWKGPRNRDMLVNIKLPPGWSFSTPWALLESNAEFSSYQPDKTPASWEARIAIGRFEIQTIGIPGAQIRLATVGDMSNEQKEKFRLWIKESVLAVSSVSGHFPQPQPQVLVIPTGKRNKAALFAQVTRGGGLAATLLVDENRPLEEFTADWTATHEFSHMLFPYISRRDRWLSEGLASYYQNVLRARNGRLTETQAWQKLYEGFERGKKGTHGGSLAQATRSGWRSTMRVYWSGAALMLKADMQLRASSDGQQSLDTALRSLSYCCLENGRTWRAKEMFAQLDELTGTDIFMRLYNQHVYEDAFPDMRSTWQALGINTRRNRVKLSNDAPLAAVRTSIMKG